MSDMYTTTTPDIQKCGTPKTLLLVEDESLLALVESKQLEKRGYRVLTVNSGEDAIETVDTNPSIDLILMDIDLGRGRIDGTVAAERILSRHDLPVVFLSNHKESEIVEKTEKITSYGYIVKDSGFTVLDTSIKMALRLHEANTAIRTSRNEIERAYEELSRRKERVKHINRILLSIRKVNQLITKETDGDMLLRQACHLLIETNGYQSAEIILLKDGRPSEPFFHEGLEDDFSARADALKGGEISPCAQEALDQGTVVFLDGARHECPGCLLMSKTKTSSPCDTDSGRKGLTVRLEHAGTVYGWMSVSLPAEYARDQEEQRLFMEIAGDLAFALRQTELEKEKAHYFSLFHENEQLLRSIFKSIKDGINILGPDLTIIHSNKTIRKLYESEAPLEGKKCYSCYFKSKEPCDPCPCLRSMKSGQLEQDIIKGPPGSGTAFVEISSYPIRDEDTGDILGCVEMIRDISEKIKNERLLIESRESMKATLKSIGDAVIATDSRGMIVGMNPVAEELTGWNVHDARGRSFQEIFSIVNAHTRIPCENIIDTVLNTGKIVGLANHTVLISKDGTEYQIADSASPIRDEKGTLFGVVVVFRNVTQEYAIREQLRINEDRLSKVLMAANDGTWDRAIATGEVHFDRRYYEMAGYRENEYPHRFEEFTSRIHPDDLNMVIETNRNHIAGKTDRYWVEFRFRKKNGEWMWILGRGKIVEWNDDGSPRRFLGTHTDISLRKKAEAELQEAFREKETLLRELKHRVKNNFSMIISMINLKMYTLDSPEAIECMEQVENRIRAFSSLYTLLYQDDHLTNIDLRIYIKEILRSMSDLYETVDLRSELSTCNAPVKEAANIGLILTELVTNALKHGFPNGRKGEILVRLEKKDSTGNLTVEHDGIPFPGGFDINTSTGVGLKMIQAMVGDLNGELKIENTDRTRVIVTFDVLGS